MDSKLSLPRAALVAAFSFLAACSTPGSAPPAAAAAPAPAPAAAKPTWDQHVAQFLEDYFSWNPNFAVSQGRHEFDGKLPDWTPAAFGREAQWLKDTQTATLAFDPALLTPAQRFEREYLLARIDNELFWLTEAELPYTHPDYYLYGGLDPNVYISRPYGTPEARMLAFIKYAHAVPAALKQVRSNLRLPLPKTFLDLAIKGFEGYASFFRDEVPKAFAAAGDPATQSLLHKEIAAAAAAMQSTADWLRREQPKGTDDFALGPEKFADMLRMTERVNTPLAELEALGKADLNRNLVALRTACAKFAPMRSIVQCIGKMAKNKPKGGAVDGARAQLADLRQFIVDHQLVSIPGDEAALVDEAPAYNRQNFAYIDIPGPYDKGMPSTYYIAPPDPTWSKADQQAYIPGQADLLFTSVHEVWPGHFLQFLHANRSPSLFGQVFVGYAYAEGWAHYGEEMMWEAGLGAGSPETHIGQLSNALLRNVRFLCSIGLHTGHMSVQTCEKMFREQAYQDPGNARQQAARGTYDPAYLNYTLGKLM
ncbi:MAG TPA: DUF885 domain-containing protein, partial [Nevskiaceae bacterium]|nr:DUF885 domain-containing protein [Nevskiaceae bacterium]